MINPVATSIPSIHTADLKYHSILKPSKRKEKKIGLSGKIIVSPGTVLGGGGSNLADFALHAIKAALLSYPSLLS